MHALNTCGSPEGVMRALNTCGSPEGVMRHWCYDLARDSMSELVRYGADASHSPDACLASRLVKQPGSGIDFYS